MDGTVYNLLGKLALKQFQNCSAALMAEQWVEHESKVSISLCIPGCMVTNNTPLNPGRTFSSCRSQRTREALRQTNMLEIIA
jgi:hypothetical protein